MKSIVMMLLAGFCLAGCATNETTPADRIDMAKALARAEEARAKAKTVEAEVRAEKLKTIAALANGNEAASVAGMMLLAMEDKPAVAAAPPPQVSPPPRAPGAVDYLFRFIDLVMNGYAIHENAATARHLSDNSIQLGIAQSGDHRAVIEAGYAAVGHTAGLIQSPVPSISIGGNGSVNGDYGDASQVLSGTGVLGAGTYAPNTNSGTGVAGAGQYGPIDQSQANQANPDNSNQGNGNTTGSNNPVDNSQNQSAAP